MNTTPPSTCVCERKSNIKIFSKREIKEGNVPKNGILPWTFVMALESSILFERDWNLREYTRVRVNG